MSFLKKLAQTKNSAAQKINETVVLKEQLITEVTTSDVATVEIQGEGPATIEKKVKDYTDEELFSIVNPETGMRFDIPMLSTIAPDYFWSYIYYMKIYLSSPEQFKKIMEWN